MLKLLIWRDHRIFRKASHSFSSIQAVRGMKDIVNEDMLKFDYIRQKATNIFKRYGYQEVQPNLLEQVELFERSIGESGEIVQKEMYRLVDLSGRKIVLRPEGTAGIVRMFNEKCMSTTVLPKKFFYCGPMYRYEKPALGRFRQFYQFGVENIGSGDVFADIELLVMVDTFMKSLKKTKNYYKIEINNLGDAKSRSNYNEVLREYFTKHNNYEKLSDLSKIRLKNNNPMRILDSKEISDIELVKDSPRITDFLSTASKEKFEIVKRNLTRLNIDYSENFNLVRGLDYYNELCFEVKYMGDDQEKTKDTLLGGGRYDNLVGQLKGLKHDKNQIPAIGFAAGMERLMLMLDEEDEWRNSEKEYLKMGIVFIWEKGENTGLNEELKIKSLEIQRAIGEGKKLLIEAAYHINKIDKQMQYFDKKNYDYVMILGSEELTSNQVKVKDMRTGEQFFVNSGENFSQELESKTGKSFF